MKNGSYSYGINAENNNIGKYLGQWYYLGGTNTSGCAEVPTRIEANGLQEAINNELAFENGDIFIKENNNGPENSKIYQDEESFTTAGSNPEDYSGASV